MGRYAWFIDHDDNHHSAFTKPSTPEARFLDAHVAFSARPDEDEAVVYLSLMPADAIKLGKALIKAGKEANHVGR